MSRLLHQLQDSHAILLMYLADELGVEDRAEVDRRLSESPGLREELQSLRVLRDDSDLALAGLDAASRAPHEERAVRSAVAAIRQWNARRMTPAPAAVEARAPRAPWMRKLAVGAAAAAAVVVSVFLLWDPEKPNTFVARPTGATEEELREQALATLVGRDFMRELNNLNPADPQPMPAVYDRSSSVATVDLIASLDSSGPVLDFDFPEEPSQP